MIVGRNDNGVGGYSSRLKAERRERVSTASLRSCGWMMRGWMARTIQEETLLRGDREARLVVSRIPTFTEEMFTVARKSLPAS